MMVGKIVVDKGGKKAYLCLILLLGLDLFELGRGG